MTSYDVRPGHVANDLALMDLIQVAGTGFHVAWKKKVTMSLFLMI